MRGLIAIFAILTSASGITHAEALTCATYRKRLDLAFQHARTGATLDVSAGRQSRTLPHTTYGLSAGTGLTGNLECFDADRLREVDFTADLKGLSGHDLVTRTDALRAIAVEATCSLAGASQERCAARATDLFARTRRQLAVVTARGDPLPEADETSDLSGDVTLDLSAEPGIMEFAIFLREPPASR